MKKTLGIVALALVVAVLGCGRFGANSETAGNKAANSSPEPTAKLVDLPSLLDKSVDEMNTILGQHQKESVGTVTFAIPKGSVYALYDMKSKKQVLLSFKFEPQTAEGMTFLGYPTAEKLGQAIGLEITGTPAKSEYEDKYYDYTINGKKCELTVGKIREAYNEAKLYCP